MSIATNLGTLTHNYKSDNFDSWFSAYITECCRVARKLRKEMAQTKDYDKCSAMHSVIKNLYIIIDIMENDPKKVRQYHEAGMTMNHMIRTEAMHRWM